MERSNEVHYSTEEGEGWKVRSRDPSPLSRGAFSKLPLLWRFLSSYGRSVTVCVFGDQGTSKNAEQVTASIKERKEDFGAIVFVGDLSYADGKSGVWDDWGRMVQRIAKRRPFMVRSGRGRKTSLLLTMRLQGIDGSALALWRVVRVRYYVIDCIPQIMKCTTALSTTGLALRILALVRGAS